MESWGQRHSAPKNWCRGLQHTPADIHSPGWCVDGEAVTDLRRVKRSDQEHRHTHTHPLPHRPPAHAPGPQVLALLLQHRPGCHTSRGCFGRTAASLCRTSEKRGGGQEKVTPGFPLVRRRPESPLCLCTSESPGLGLGLPPESRGGFITCHRDRPHKHIRIFLEGCVFSAPSFRKHC